MNDTTRYDNDHIKPHATRILDKIFPHLAEGEHDPYNPIGATDATGGCGTPLTPAVAIWHAEFADVPQTCWRPAALGIDGRAISAATIFSKI